MLLVRVALLVSGIVLLCAVGSDSWLLCVWEMFLYCVLYCYIIILMRGFVVVVALLFAGAGMSAILANPLAIVPSDVLPVYC